MNELIYCDVIEKLKKEISEIKLRISALIQEKEELEYHICPELKAEYYEKIGKIEVNIRMLELTADELKYRISILQAAINRREKVSEEKVEKKVEEKYSEYRKKYEEAYEKAQEEKKEQEDHQKRKQENREKYEKDKGAEHKEDDETGKDATSGKDGRDSERNRDGGKGTKDDYYKNMSYSQKIKELYRRIVKKLHPDINPKITEHEKELFYETQKAYKDENLEKLEEIYEEITSAGAEVGNNSSVDDIERLKEIKEKLLKKIEALEKEITAIKSSFPYSEKDMLSDPEALAARQEEFNSIIKTYQEIVDELTEIYNKLKDELYNPKEKSTAREKDKVNTSSDENKDAKADTESTKESDDSVNIKTVDEPEEFWE